MKTPFSSRLIAAALAVLIPAHAHAGIDPSNKFKLGDGTASNKIVEANKGSGAANPKIRWAQSVQKWQFTNDGTNFKDLGSGSGSGSGINLISENNPDFEVTTLVNWTAVGGSFTSVTSGSNLLIGGGSALFNASATGQTVTSDAITVDTSTIARLGGAAGSVSCWFKTTATDYKIQAWDGTNVLHERVIPALAAPQQIGVSFGIPTTGTIALRIISQSNAADLAIDNCFLGSTSAIQMAQARHAVESYFPSDPGCQWDRTTITTMGDFPTDAACLAPVIVSSGVGTWLTTDADLPQWTATNLPAGIYQFEFQALLTNDGAAGNAMYMQMHDGTSSSGFINNTTDGATTTFRMVKGTAVFTYTSAQASRTFKLQGQYTNGTFLGLNNENPNTRIVVSYWPLASDQAQSFATTAQSWQGYFPHTTCAFAKATAPTVMGAFDDDGTCALIESSNTNFGTVTKNATGIGIDVPIPGAGKYEVCADTVSYDGTAPTELSLQLRDSTGYVIKETSFTEAANNDKHNVEVCGEWPVASAGTKTLQLYAKSTLGSAYEINGISGSTPSVTWRIKKINEQQPAPVLLGAVAAPHAGAVNVCAFEFGGSTADSICSVASCTIRKSTCGAPTVARLSGGDFEATFPASTFSAAPACTSSGFSWPSTNASANLITTTSTTARFQYYDDTATQRDVQANVICIGPK